MEPVKIDLVALKTARAAWRYGRLTATHEDGYHQLLGEKDTGVRRPSVAETRGHDIAEYGLVTDASDLVALRYIADCVNREPELVAEIERLRATVRTLYSHALGDKANNIGAAMKHGAELAEYEP